MKANELMIGDWVMSKGLKTPVEVCSIMNHYETTIYFCCQGNEFIVNSYQLEPIPLTSEILEKNGLASDPYGCHFKEDKYMALEISVEDDGIYWTINYNEYGILKLKYVHELQHALRLCKIDKEIVV